jgi:hypothetical protein
MALKTPFTVQRSTYRMVPDRRESSCAKGQGPISGEYNLTSLVDCLVDVNIIQNLQGFPQMFV